MTHEGRPRFPQRPPHEIKDSTVSVERTEWLLGNAAIRTISEIREVLFALAEQMPAFKSYMLSSRAPDDAECVQWVARELISRDVDDT